jgi:eukaryotic-like serine/threonine-protein kinase
MDIERWPKIDELYHQASQLNPSERASFLAKACDGDEYMRAQVESLLGFDGKADFMEKPALGVAAQLLSEVPIPEMIGHKIGHYQILEKLGSGGMGVVYKARDEHLHRFVAMKVLPESFAADAERLNRFEQEARAASALNHPNVITIYDVAQVNRTPYIVMEFVEGQTLRQMISGEPLPIATVIRVGEQLAEGLSKVHAAGLIHRDLKPENVMVRRDGLAKILDFGLAKFEPVVGDASEAVPMSQTTNSGLVGTLNYISPEQIRKRPVDFRSDQFSFGCIVHEMATGRCVFQRETPTQTLSAITDETVESMATLRPDAPLQLSRVVERCLSKDRAQRYQSTEDLVRELRQIRDALFVSAAPQMRGSFKRTAFLTACVAALLSVGVGVNRVLRERAANSQKQLQSLAVLPLENLSHGEQDGYFADGMTEELITEIGRTTFPLRVISRDTVMQYKRTRKTVRDIADELKVDAVLEGSVLLSGKNVKITEKLVRAVTQEELWSNRYEGSTEDVLNLQRRVARDVARQINSKTTPDKQTGPERTKKVDTDAHWDYFVGLHYYNNRFEGNPEDLHKSTEYFDQAIQKDPNYAPAYSARATSYIVQVAWGMLLASDAFPAAKQDVMKSLTLDPTRAQPHVALGGILLDYEWDWPTAEAEFRKAIEMDPNYTEAYLGYSKLLSLLEQHDEALAMLQHSLQQDPLSVVVNRRLGLALYWARRYDVSIQQYLRTLQLDPRSHPIVEELALAYEMAGKPQEAFEQYQQWARLGGVPESRTSMFEAAYKSRGMKGYWQKRLEMEIEDEKRGDVWTYVMAALNARVGNNQQALAWLERAYLARDVGVNSLKVDPVFDGLRSDPKFIDLIRRIGLP